MPEAKAGKNSCACNMLGLNYKIWEIKQILGETSKLNCEQYKHYLHLYTTGYIQYTISKVCTTIQVKQ